MKKRIIGTVGILIVTLMWFACSPIREFMTTKPYNGKGDFKIESPKPDTLKKTVVIIADNDGTEIFDMMAPYYLFNATEKANVYVIAETKDPIVANKGVYILPQFTFKEFDRLNIKPDVIVIPNLSARDSAHQKPVILSWIKNNFLTNTKMLTVCDGALTGAATGLYNGQPITAHASDIAHIKGEFGRPKWINNISTVNSGNLYSTAGVSNATDGSLYVIQDIFGKETMEQVKKTVNYSGGFPNTSHKSNKLNISTALKIIKKVTFSNDKRIGVLLQDGIDEIKLAGLIDTYSRSIPESIETFVVKGNYIKSKYGLTIIPTGDRKTANLDELHVIDPSTFSKDEETLLRTKEVIRYDSAKHQYIIDECLDRISDMYGNRYAGAVKILLDYN